jgi:hypothetical protein
MAEQLPRNFRSTDVNEPEGFYFAEKANRRVRDEWQREEEQLAAEFPEGTRVAFNLGGRDGEGTVCGYDRDVRGALVLVKTPGQRTKLPYAFTRNELRKI